MKPWKRNAFGLGAIMTIAAVAVFGLSRCTPSDRSTEELTENEEADLNQKAMEAEMAEAKIAQVAVKGAPAAAKAGKAVAKTDAKTASKAEPKAAAKTVAAAKPEAKTEGARKPASHGSVYVVQVGAFKTKENAEKLQAKLKDLGYPIVMQTIEHSKNGTLHLVRSEPMNDRSEAESVVEKLKEKEFSATVLPVSAGM